MSVLESLQPSLVWKYFDEVSAVPRPSKHEEKIIEYLVATAKSLELNYKQDDIGNVVIYKPATAGKINSPTVILQSHMDMVCEKNSDVEFDFMTEPIKVKIVDEWVTAEGTTLGADCGIGMAAALAVLADNTLEHPAIEALFTVDEETGLTGAFELDGDLLTGSYLINLDSEDEGEIFIGCAGGVDTLATFKYQKESAPSNLTYYTLEVSGLKGGHSGCDIHRGYANSNKIASFLLARIIQKCEEFALCDFNGGNLRNAIPREAKVIFGLSANDNELVNKLFNKYAEELVLEYSIIEPNMKLSLHITEKPKYIVNKEVTKRLINSLIAVDNGVIAMSSSIEGLVETSTNLASVKFVDDNKIIVTTSQRSSLLGAKQNTANSIEALFLLAGAEVAHSDGYPGWNPNPNSKLLEIVKNHYKELFNVDPKVLAVHAGLECGLFLEKYPYLDMISFGPTIEAPHSPDERLNISTVEKFWKLLTATLKAI